MRGSQASSEQNRHRLDKNLLRRAFERAAPRYDEAALLQREVGRRMLERLDLIQIKPQVILDIGCGTGSASRALTQRYKDARLVSVDLAFNMLKEARQRLPFLTRWRAKRPAYICADAECLPFDSASADMIFSNLTLQWCDDLDRVFAEFRRVLKPGGLLMFSTFGPDTLKELRASWAQVDDFNHINAFMDMHDIGDALVRARLATPVMDVEHFTLTYPDVLKLMHDLKTLGAHNVTAGRAYGLTGKGRLKALTLAYENYRTAGLLPASYEVVYGHAWGPDHAGMLNTEPGVAKVSLQQVRRSLRRS